MKIGIFDSGIGGEAVADKLKLLLPYAEIKLVNDHKNIPYGNRSDEEIIRLTDNALKPLIGGECDAIIIACNTATTVALPQIRLNHPDVNFIGIEPMLKPASKLTKSKHIAVCATTGTLLSDRYKKLKEQWLYGVKVTEPDCSNWAELIEKGNSNLVNVEDLVEYLKQKDVDVIVLGCTHYHWLKQRFEFAAGSKITVLEPSDAIAERIKAILS